MMNDGSNKAEATPEAVKRDHLSLVTVASTAAVLLSAAAVLFRLRRTSLTVLFDGSFSIGTQSIIGITIGIAAGGGQLLLLRSWRRWREFTRRAVLGLRLTPARIVMVSLTVAVTEELFFRAALQPLVGFWAAAALFTLVHLRFDRAALARTHLLTTVVTVGLLFGMGALLGLVFVQVGLSAAIGTHFAYDVIVMAGYRELCKARTVDPPNVGAV